MPRVNAQGLAREESRVVGVRCANALADAWRQRVKEDPEAVDELRRYMHHLLEQPIKAKPDAGAYSLSVGEPFVPTSEIDNGNKKPVKLQFTPSEHAALVFLAEQQNCSIQFWIVGLVRAVLTQGTTFGGAELEQLGRSNYQLMAIGRNLNQITHQINADPGRNMYRITSRLIENLTAKIDGHRMEVHRLIEACSHRWKLKHQREGGSNGR